jgi:ribose transport system permease protein
VSEPETGITREHPEPPAAWPPAGDLARLGWRGIDWLTWLGPYLGLALVVGLFSYLTWRRGELDKFLSLDNLRLIVVHSSIGAAVAVGMTWVMISGGIDLSVGYVVSLATVATVLVHRWATGTGYPLLVGTADAWAIAAGLATGALAGLGNGLLITRLQIVPFVATLGMMGAARGLAQHLSEGKPVVFRNVIEPPAWVSWLRAIDPEPPWLVLGPAAWSVLLLGVVAAAALHYTVLGRYCYALGSSEATARLCGIRVDRTKVVIYTLAGLMTGWAGVLQTARSGSGFYNIQAGLELEVIAAVVIGGGSLAGGAGTVSGTLVGALLLGVLDNGCSKLRLQNEFRFIVIGAIIVVIAALNSWRQRRLR